MASDPVTKALSGAKSALAGANKAFPSAMAPKNPAPAKASAKTSSSISTGEPEKGIKSELQSKADNVDSYVKSLPKLHDGGPVKKDGAYQLKAGEHVLTPVEAKIARRHAIAMSGLKSLAKYSSKKTGGEPAKPKTGEKKTTSTITVRPEKNQDKKIPDQAKQ
jgi:hypothetical protein